MSRESVNTFNGMRVIESPYLTQPGTPYTVRRTWRERLFSRPWRPLVVTRTVVPQVPYDGVVKLNEHTLVMHPEMFRKLKTMMQS